MSGAQPKQLPAKAVSHRVSYSAPFRKIATGVSLFTAISLIAISGYMAAGWDLFDAIYMVIITIFGVGYGEVRPVESPSLRALTIMVIVAGYGAVIYTVGGFVQMLIDGELNKALGARRMTRGIERLDGHTIICGVGRMGTILARELQATGREFVIIDCDPQRLQQAEEAGYLVIHGDATDEQILDQAGIMRASTLASVLSDDALNVFVTITARELNSEITIIARGENPRTEKKLLGCGANKVVLPTAIGAHKVAQLIVRPSAETMMHQISEQRNMQDDLYQIGLEFDELSVASDSELVNQQLSEIEVRGNHGFLIVGIRKQNGSSLLNPPPTTILEAGDIVVVLGHQEDIPQLSARFEVKKKGMNYRGITY